jgi:transcriptional antiterminator NusG
MTALYNIGDFVGYAEPPVVEAPIPKLWYMIRVMPNRELTVQDKLLTRGVCVYVPRETWSQRTVWNRRRICERPIFDGVIFVPDFDADIRRLRGYTDGLIGFVRFGDRAACAAAQIMEAIHRIEERLRLPLGKRKFAAGQQVRVISGPFGYFEGMIERLDSHGRLKVLLHVFERQVSVELEEAQIEPV